MGLEKFVEDPIDSKKDKQVNCRRAGGASKAESSMLGAYYGICVFRTRDKKE